MEDQTTEDVNKREEPWVREVLDAPHPGGVVEGVVMDRDPLAEDHASVVAAAVAAALPVSNRQTNQLPLQLQDDAHENGSKVGSDSLSPDRNAAGQFVKGNNLWRDGQEARIKRAVEVRAERLARTKAIMATLRQVDCEAAVRRLIELTGDNDGKIALAAIKMILDVVVVKDGGEVDPDGRVAGGSGFVFVIPVELPTSPR